MKKLQSLRDHLTAKIPALAANPDKLLVFAEEGEVQDTPRTEHLSYQYAYTATLVLTDFSGVPNLLMAHIIAWLKLNQPDRGERKALDFSAEILSNSEVDIEIRIPLTEFIQVTETDGTLTAETKAEVIYTPDFIEDDTSSEWRQHNV